MEEETLSCSLVEEGGNPEREQRQAATWASPSPLEVTGEPRSAAGVSEAGAQRQVGWEEVGSGWLSASPLTALGTEGTEAASQRNSAALGTLGEEWGLEGLGAAEAPGKR